MTSFQKAKDRIAQGILGLSRSYSGNKRSILRLEEPCPRVNCLDWLYAQAGEVKLYWADRDNSFQMAGIGIADQARGEVIHSYASVFQAISRKLSSGDQSRYYGGMGFYPPEANRGRASKSAKAREWKAFGGYCFLLPRFEIVNRRGKYFLACNIAAQHIGELLIKDCLGALEKISFSVASRAASILKIKSLSLSPDSEEWQKLFREHIQPAGKMAYEKIILAQNTSIELTSEVNPLEVFRKLTQAAQGSFHYYFQPLKNCAFFGASPERLLKRQGVDIESEALAGTRPRGKTPREDAYYERALRDSPKEELEQGIVVRAIKGAFKKLCVSWEADSKPSVAKASSAHHLITRFRGTLKDNVDDARILTVLHPTPAVGGIPRAEALKAIAKLEPFERGWYAGPIGYIGYDCVDFAVALRCALMKDNLVNLYAGAGIVEGSSADEEWQEIEQKKSIFLNLFRKR